MSLFRRLIRHDKIVIKPGHPDQVTITVVDIDVRNVNLRFDTPDSVRIQTTSQPKEDSAAVMSET